MEAICYDGDTFSPQPERYDMKPWWLLLFGMSAHAGVFDDVTTAVMNHSVYHPYRYDNTVLLRPPERIRADMYKVVLCQAHFCDTTLQTLLYNPQLKRLVGRVYTSTGVKTIGYPTYEEDALLQQHDEKNQH